MTERAQDPEIDALITDEVRSWIGRTTELLTLPEDISASDIRRYTDATGDENPLWMDDEAARRAGYKARIVPPMMVLDLSWRLSDTQSGHLWLKIPLPPEYNDVRNADMEVEWLAPVYLGDRLSVRHRIVDIVAKRGRRGLGAYIARESKHFNQNGTLIARVNAIVARFARARLGAG
jgi:acyl dehydratase